MARFLKNSDLRFHLVGLRSGFFLGLILLLLAGVVGLGIWKQEWFRGAKNYRMIAETSEGLQTGMAVRLSGFRIGKVDRIELVGPGEVAVEVKVFNEYVKYVRTDSVATVRGENLIGDRFIDLTAGSESSPLAREGEEISIGAEATISDMFDELKSEFTPLLTKLEGVIDESQRFVEDLRSDEGGMGGLKRSFAEFNVTLGKLNDGIDNIAGVDSELIKALDQFEDVTSAISENPDKIQDDIKIVVENLKSASRKLDEGMTDAVSLLKEANDVVEDLGDTVDEAAPEVPEMVRKGSRTMDKADDVMSAVRDMWPIRGGVSKDEGKTLRTTSDD